MAARAGLAQALLGALVPGSPPAAWGWGAAGARRDPGHPHPGGGGRGQGWGGLRSPLCPPRGWGHRHGSPPTSTGAEAAGAERRFPIKRVYLAPALLTPKREGLKVNSLSIPYCQLIHHPGRAGAARALVGLGRVTKGSCVRLPPPPHAQLWLWRGGEGPKFMGRGWGVQGGQRHHHLVTATAQAGTVLLLTAPQDPPRF